MSNCGMEIVEYLSNGKLIIKIEKEIMAQKETKKVIKFTIADENSIVNILDSKGNLSGIQFFDSYSLNEFGDIIIGIKKDGEEYYNRILSHIDLSDTEIKTMENPSGPFNIGPYAKQYYDIKYPSQSIKDIIPQDYSFNYGVINRDGLLVIYPMYDQIHFGTENTCIVGFLSSSMNLKFGYNDVLSGEAITPICFNIARNFSEGKALVLYKNRYGYINRHKVMTDPQNISEYSENLAPKFFNATDFKNGIASVILTKDNHFGSSIRANINEKGDIIEFLPHARVTRKRKLKQS